MSQLPSQYELYRGGENVGLQASGEGFTLNGIEIQLFAGSAHYFRIPPEYWRDRLRKLRACGLVAVTTYVPWNLHEPVEGQYDFGSGQNDFSPFLNIVEYLKIAEEEDLFVILRPGPYICSEWELGGLPSWLLKVPNVKIRTSNEEYMKRVKNYFQKLLPLLKDLQFTRGGPIIGFQVENEYGAYGIPHDPDYLPALKSIMTETGGVQEFLFTSDNFYNDNGQPLPLHREGAVQDALMTINFQSTPEYWLTHLKDFQPNLPVMVMEYWTGWFDHWLVPKDKEYVPPKVFKQTLETILSFPGHVNFYMFHGGTNFGFMNGSNQTAAENYSPDVTSYDYEAPLQENGDYTQKYQIAKELLEKYTKTKTRLPDPPTETPRIALPNAPITQHIRYPQILDQVSEHIESENLLSMEELNIDNNAGQSYGFITYHKEKVSIDDSSTLQITGYVHDIAYVLIDGSLVSEPLEKPEDVNGFGYWIKKDGTIELKVPKPGNHDIDILVENMGRVNYGTYMNVQKKGLYDGPITINGEQITKWTHIPLEFQSKWLSNLEEWLPFDSQDINSPGLYKANFNLESTNKDTFLDMTGWRKGVVFVNGFNLGRYWDLGPQKTLYLPGPLLRTGENEIVVFEIFKPASSIKFSDKPLLK